MKWQKCTDIELFDNKDWDKLYHLRVKYPSYQFTSEMVKKYLSHMSIVEQDYLRRFKKHKEEFLEILKGTKRGWIASNNVVPSPPKTIAEVILTFIVQPYLKSALRFYNEQNIPMFLMDFDFSSGIMEIPGYIMGASTDGEGGGRQAANYGMIEGLKHYGPLSSNEADRQYNEQLKAYQYHRTLLLQDQTGAFLISKIISCLEAERSAHTDEIYHNYIPSWQNRALFLAGSYFGKRAYLGLYELWKEEGFSYVFS